MPADQASHRYVSVGPLARGGMGQVELGLRCAGSFERVVAIKRLRPEFREDVAFQRMFLEEARIAGLVRHPNIVSVLDVGEDEGGAFLVMDFVDGLTASKLLRLVSERTKLVPIQIAMRIVQQVTMGLAAAHALRQPDGSIVGLIHRDISPQNILLGFDGVARLTDFGIAKALGVSSETTTGLLKGKAGYMSPEQLRFDPPTQKSDLFALGVVLFELVSGRRLYRGKDSARVAKQVLSEPAPDLYAERQGVPTELVELCFELLAKDPADRPDSAEEVSQRLNECIDDVSTLEGPLRLADYLLEHFSDERAVLQERSASLIRKWKAKPAAANPTRRPPPSAKAFLAAAVAAICAVGMYVAFAPEGAASETGVPEGGVPEVGVPEVPPAETVSAETASAPQALAQDTSASPVVHSVEPAERSDERTPAPGQTETQGPDEESEPTPMTRRRRRRRTATAMAGMSEMFDPLDLIRSGMQP